MIRPADAGSTPIPALIRFRTGARIEPDITVKVPLARIIHRVNRLNIFIISYWVLIKIVYVKAERGGSYLNVLRQIEKAVSGLMRYHEPFFL